MELKYTESKKISLKKHFNEKWLQNRIEENPLILGLGELDLIARERKQSSGGRIDFLFYNSEIQTMYETEIQLGATDESHIIRTIEYWDIEKRRFPSKEHKAVIIAEEITNRFFNVIALMNRAIPIIAIQVNAIQIEDKIILNFTKVLDTYESPEDEEQLAGEEVDRNYWEKKSNTKSIQVMDQMIELAKEKGIELRITYNKYHIAVGTDSRNFMWFHPRKSAHCRFQIKIEKDSMEETNNLLEEIDLSFTQRKEDMFSIAVNLGDLKKNTDTLKDLIHKSIDFHS